MPKKMRRKERSPVGFYLIIAGTLLSLSSPVIASIYHLSAFIPLIVIGAASTLVGVILEMSEAYYDTNN